MKVKHIIQDTLFFLFLLSLVAGALYLANEHRGAHKFGHGNSGIINTIPTDLFTLYSDKISFYNRHSLSTVKVLSDSGTGSGFYVDDHYVVTNSHVVHNQPAVRVINADGYQGALVIHNNPSHDVALLYVGGDSQKPLLFGDSDLLEVGQEVRAIGAPYGFELTYSIGMITGLKRVVPLAPFYGLIQVDANIAPGSSGSALLDTDGKIVGLNFAAMNGSASFGFAIPINMIRDEILQNIELHKNPVE